MAKSESMRLELERRQDELCNSMSMEDITWDANSGWETMHRQELYHPILECIFLQYKLN